MREISADAWEVESDVLCITTNCTIYNDRVTQEPKNVMGGGIAKGAADRFPGLDAAYAAMIQTHGHHVFLIGDLLMFPTKNDVSQRSTISRIAILIMETKLIADIY